MNRRAALWTLALCLAQSVAAQTVGLTGVMGGKALLVVDAGAPRLVGPGETFKGVKVLAVQADSALVEAGSHRFTVRLGDAPGAAGGDPDAAPGAGNRIVLTASTGGHFLTSAQLNGTTVRAMVDTGASAVAITSILADQMGINYRSGTPVQMRTANGAVDAWRIKLTTLRVGDVTVYGVDAIVGMGDMPYVLLGNTFLSRFQMTRTNDQMVLEKRY